MSEAPARQPLPAGLAEPAFDPNALRVLRERYFARRADGTVENPQEFLWRVASAVAEPERPYAQALGRDPEAVASGVAHAFYELLARRDFMPNTPCLVNAGRPLSMLSACFVLPVPDSIEGIFYNLKAMALIQKAGGGCIAGDARVWSTFCGLEPIEVLFARTTADGRAGERHGNGVAFDVSDLDVRTLSMDPVTGASGLAKVSRVWSFDVPAEAQLVVCTREGVAVQTSAWHPFMVVRGTRLVEVRADALAAGDVILGPDEPDAYWPWKEYRTVGGMALDEETAWLVGFTLGDGSYGRWGAKLRLRWFSGTLDVLERVRSVLARHGVIVNAIAGDRRGKTRAITTLDQGFIARFAALCGLAGPGPKDLTIRIPEMIGKSPLSVVRAFVAGLMDSDGCVDPDGSPSYTTASEAMASDLAALASLLGFQPTVRRKEPYGRGVSTTYAVLLTRLSRLSDFTATIAPAMSARARVARLEAGGGGEGRQLQIPIGPWRELLRKHGLARVRGTTGATGRCASELERWSCNAAGRVRRRDLEAIASELAAFEPETAALLRRLARVGLEIAAAERATIAKPFYDLTVEGWNTYAAGHGGLAMIHNTGFAFSELRYQGAPVHSTGKDASGPVSFMKVFNAATDSIKQGGVRRGANMGVLRVDHPDIVAFMRCKKELDAENRALYNRFSDTGRYTQAQLAHLKQELLQTQINNFNISVGVTDAFMAAVKEGADFALIDPRSKATVQTLPAREIWDAIVEGAWQNGEPGVLFLDHPEVNPLPGLGPIQATNPCVTGDTLVAVADGRGHVRIDELAREGNDVPVFCFNARGRLAVRMMRHPRKTGERVPVFRVVLDDGSVLRATASHKFRLRDGSYKSVGELAGGESLALVTRYKASLKEVFPNANSRSQDYWWITAGGAANRLEHRYIAEFAHGTKLRPGLVVHHRDYNGQNNTPANLRIMTRAEHDALHREDKLGDRNPMRRALIEWSEERWTAYRARHSANNFGTANKRFSGVSNEHLRQAALDLTRTLGRRFSEKEWASHALACGIPQQFSGWRRKHLNGGVLGLAKWAAIELGFDLLANVDPRVVKRFRDALEQGYDPEIVGGLLFVCKRCEICDEEFRTPYVYREVANCSRACNLKKLNGDPAIHALRHEARATTLTEKRTLLRERQLDVYTEVRARLGEVSKRAWSDACRARGISAEISRRSSPFRSFAALGEAASTFNHRVVSVAYDGQSDVYNGTVDEFHNFLVGAFEATTRSGKQLFSYIGNMQCGEQFLHGYDSCNLGSLNVGHYYDGAAKDVDWERLAQSTVLAIRFLDNVIDANIYPLPEIEAMVKGNRRVGLGIMGFADLLIQMGIPYGSPESAAFAERLMRFIQERAVEASEALARERGDFPNKGLSRWANDPRPRRNAALLSIAPTGTISMIAGCSFGCEPYFGMAYTKHVMKDAEGRPQHLYYVVPLFEEIAKDEGFFSDELLAAIEENRGSVRGLREVPERLQRVFTVAADVSVDAHIAMLAAFQKYTCNAVSKTINAPNDDTKENVARAIFRAYESGCKGFTYYRDGSRTEQVVTFSKDGDLAGGNRDIGTGGAASATTDATPLDATARDSAADAEIAALLARAHALLEA
ncbi:MAG: ribonucleotide reductase N-terminal alpha domain-containing protein [Vulcanimicrobiaceae bacterium]